ncbi:MAG: hypothetical protein ACR5LH_17495, partial [Sodalis sp. (in: enterobacteria)]
MAFDIKAPTMSDYGMAIYGRDGKVAFTSNEVPMLVRGYVNTPPERNATIGLPNWHQGPMIPAALLNKSELADRMALYYTCYPILTLCGIPNNVIRFSALTIA